MRLAHEGGKATAKALTKNSTLTVLDLFRKLFCRGCKGVWSDAWREHDSYRAETCGCGYWVENRHYAERYILLMSGNYIGDGGVNEIGKGLDRNSTLTTLDLRSKYFSTSDTEKK